MNTLDPFLTLREYESGVALATPQEVADARSRFFDSVVDSQGPAAREISRPTRLPRSARALAIAMLVLTCLVATSIAAISHFTNPPISVDDSKGLGSLSKVSELEIFKQPSIATFAGSHAESEIKSIAEKSDHAEGSAALDYASARAVPIPDSNYYVWAIPTRGDELCLFSPANGGFNSTCAGLEVINKSGMISTPSGASPDSLLALSVSPNNETGLTIRSTDGNSRTVEPFRGVVVAQVKPDDLVSNGVATLNLGAAPEGQVVPPLPSRHRSTN